MANHTNAKRWRETSPVSLSHRERAGVRAAFTLTELLIVISIIAILAGLALSALATATEQARAQRTRAIVNKLDQLISEKWESYRTRAVPIRIPAGTNPTTAAQRRLYALRELQRMELPNCKTDVLLGTGLRPVAVTGMTISSLQRSYFRMAGRATGGNINNWSTVHEGAECLYMIVSTMRDGDKSAIDFFSPSEIGDVDLDGMKEILDGWGKPVEFIRWAPAYTIQNQALTLQTSDATVAPDPFDPVKCDPRWTTNSPNGPFPFALTPLIFSAGPDKSYDIIAGSVVYTTTNPPNDPYDLATPVSNRTGTPTDADGDGNARGWADNITNHYQAAE